MKMKNAKSVAAIIFSLGILVSYVCYQHHGSLWTKPLANSFHINVDKQPVRLLLCAKPKNRYINSGGTKNVVEKIIN
jgi:hypothetical protein